MGKLQQVSSPTEKFARMLYCILGKFQQRIPKSSAKITIRRYEVYIYGSLQQNYIKLHQVYNMQDIPSFEGISLHIKFNITTGHDLAYTYIYIRTMIYEQRDDRPNIGMPISSTYRKMCIWPYDFNKS